MVDSSRPVFEISYDGNRWMIPEWCRVDGETVILEDTGTQIATVTPGRLRCRYRIGNNIITTGYLTLPKQQTITRSGDII